MTDHDLSVGDAWSLPYRGMTLHLSGEGDVYWRPYRGKGRLYLEEVPDTLVQQLRDLKPTGAMFRVTENGDVLAKLENKEEDSYDPVWAGELTEATPLVVEANSPSVAPKSERTIELTPTGLLPGDLWPSVYDGTRFSMTGLDDVWWEDGSTNHRYPVESGIPRSILEEIRLRKPSGGSFRVTPWGDVITLVETVPKPEDLAAQFDALPGPVRQIIRIRKERGVEMVPVYMGAFDTAQIELMEPSRLDEELSAEREQEMRAWIKSLGPTSAGDQDRSAADGDRADNGDKQDTQPAGQEPPTFDDDPEAWAGDDFGNEFDRDAANEFGSAEDDFR